MPKALAHPVGNCRSRPKPRNTSIGATIQDGIECSPQAVLVGRFPFPCYAESSLCRDMLEPWRAAFSLSDSHPPVLSGF